MTKIYVGNLPFSATESEVRDLFAQHGTVDSVALPTDRETGRPRGFGFVEMPQADAQKAMEALNGFNMGGRPCASMRRRIVRVPAAAAVVRAAAVAARVAAATAAVAAATAAAVAVAAATAAAAAAVSVAGNRLTPAGV
jgi:4-hydroxyphenylpyruvate dioxygenase-like putative hemolysin